MKVLLISHTCQSLVEGQPKARFLGAMSDIELCVLTPDRWKAYGRWHRAQKPQNPSYGFKVGKVMWPWSGPGQTYLHWYPSLPALLQRFRPDVIDLWEEPWSLVSAQTCFWRDRLLPDSKIIAETEQNIDKKLPPPFESFRSYVLKRADFVVGRNQESLEIVRRKGFSGLSQVVPNAVDTHLFGPLDKQECKKKLGISGFIVGYAGRLVEEKGLLEIVEAMPQLAAEVRVILVGSGPFEATLRERAKALRVEERITFIPAQPLEKLPELFNAFDVLVLPSRTGKSWKEQFGRVLIEAGACGLPVIGSDSGAIPEVVGNAGLTFPEGDAAALAQAITMLHSQPQLCRQMGQIGRQSAEERFSWECVAQQMAQIYRGVNASHRLP